MGHHITALIVPEPFDEHAARTWDVIGIPLPQSFRLVHISIFYTSFWQHRRGETSVLDLPPDAPEIFPSQGVVRSLAADLTGRRPPTFALIQTDYFGGHGFQFACAYIDGVRAPGDTVDAALQHLGVVASPALDEFDTLGLSSHRQTPDEIERYREFEE